MKCIGGIVLVLALMGCVSEKGYETPQGEVLSKDEAATKTPEEIATFQEVAVTRLKDGTVRTGDAAMSILEIILMMTTGGGVIGTAVGGIWSRWKNRLYVQERGTRQRIQAGAEITRDAINEVVKNNNPEIWNVLGRLLKQKQKEASVAVTMPDKIATVYT
jgi:hypothetical protein